MKNAVYSAARTNGNQPEPILGTAVLKLLYDTPTGQSLDSSLEERLRTSANYARSFYSANGDDSLCKSSGPGRLASLEVLTTLTRSWRRGSS